MPRVTPSKLADKYETFDSAEKAAVAGLRGITEKHVETGGGILFNPDSGKYAYTDPVGQNNGAHFQAAVQIPPGWHLAGMYHIHPTGNESTKFSDDDIGAALQLKIPSYVLPIASNKVIRFDPTSTPVSKSVNGRFSLGDPVDETPPEKSASPLSSAPPNLAPLAGITGNPMSGLAQAQ